MADRSLLGVYELQHYLKFTDTDGDQKYIRVTETNSAEAERESEDYETEYIDRKEQSKYQLSSTESIEFELDAMLPGGIQRELLKREDDSDVPAEYVRTLTYNPETDQKVGEDELYAKHANCLVNVSPLTGEAGSPAKITCSVSISGSYDKGTFDAKTLTYTPAVAPEDEENAPQAQAARTAATPTSTTKTSTASK